MPFKRDDIARRIAKVAGVREVHDNDSNFWSYAIMPNPPIHIVVEHGRVTLTGGVRATWTGGLRDRWPRSSARSR